MTRLRYRVVTPWPPCARSGASGAGSWAGSAHTPGSEVRGETPDAGCHGAARRASRRAGNAPRGQTVVSFRFPSSVPHRLGSMVTLPLFLALPLDDIGVGTVCPVRQGARDRVSPVVCRQADRADVGVPLVIAPVAIRATAGVGVAQYAFARVPGPGCMPVMIPFVRAPAACAVRV